MVTQCRSKRMLLVHSILCRWGRGEVIPDKVNIAVTPSVGHSCPCTWAKHRYQSSKQYLLPLRPVTDQPMNVITRDHLLLMEQSLEMRIVPQLIKK